MKNKVSYLVYPNFFIIYCNGEIIKKSMNLEKLGTAYNLKRAHTQARELKEGVHRNKDVQKRFDSVLNK